jgi:hypothetical protein
VEEVRFVKGILSTAQHSMFFSMTLRRTSHLDLPDLTYYGKYDVNFLPRKGYRDSGLSPTESIKKSEVENFIKAIYLFSRFDGNTQLAELNTTA